MKMSWPGLPARAVDLIIAIGVAVALLVAGLSADRPATDLSVFGLALLIIGGLSLAVRRRAPVAALMITGACAVGHQAIGFDVAAIAFLVAVYSAMRAGRRVATAVAALLLLGTLPLAVLVSTPGLPVGEAMIQARGVLELAWLIAAAAAGEALRQAERRADEAERTRDETARRRADEERLHIARELHDTLTHQISVITVQSGTAVHLAQQRGEQVPAALLAIQGASRDASRELRATLEALRDDSRTRPHGLAQLPELLERARTSGLDATLSIEGDRHAVPAAVDRTAYRIVQESLTNIDRHASATSARVRLVFGTDVLAIHVDDDGSATAPTAVEPGVGLLGMRERVTALGGRLRTGPKGEGGFAVHAELPVAGRA